MILRNHRTFYPYKHASGKHKKIIFAFSDFNYSLNTLRKLSELVKQRGKFQVLSIRLMIETQ